MDRESGFHTSGAPYEYTVAEKKTPLLLFKKITLIALYVLWVAVLLFVGFGFELIVPLLALVPLSLWMLVFFTWRLVQVEYEYSFFAGTLTVSRVLGGRSRRVLAEVPLKSLSEVLPYEDDYVSKIEAFGAERTVFAASDESSDGIYALLWNDEEHGRMALFLELNEKAVKILRYYNASAMARK
ncbi:MAG: hypothetical protein IKA05_06450 [Clostridia bacterium]|nr:hypothetical protein [Clostridia bacterium]